MAINVPKSEEERFKLKKYYENFFSGMDFDMILLVMHKRGFIMCKREDLEKINEIEIPYSQKVVYRLKNRNE